MISFKQSAQLAGLLMLGAMAGCSSIDNQATTETAAATTTTPRRNTEAPPPAPPKQQQVARTVERTPLSAEELRAAMAGNSVYVGAGGSEFAAYHNSNGSLAGRAWGTGQEQTGAGSWKIDEKGQYCRKWDNAWSGGQWGCFKVYKEGEQLQMERVSGAGANGPMKLQTGNPHDL
ncbi:MAG: hypothetical protein K8F25_04155 [Fimbriimonadaceae bacterium]|nr:hypothetical protein [Alphaproteobacteria bacterium]